MTNLYLYVQTKYSRESQSVSGFRKFEPADVFNFFGFIPQVLRDALR
jgi:hypothetical protein